MLDETKINRWVEINFQREIVHQFKEEGLQAAIKDEDSVDVAYLANLHRHTVHFHVRVNVLHNDREIEFFALKRYCQSIFPGDTHYVGTSSMEQLGEKLLTEVLEFHPNREWEIRVLEDGENGAVIHYDDVA